MVGTLFNIVLASLALQGLTNRLLLTSRDGRRGRGGEFHHMRNPSAIPPLNHQIDRSNKKRQICYLDTVPGK